MSDDTTDKPFKTLKLTSLKSAKASVPVAVSEPIAPPVDGAPSISPVVEAAAEETAGAGPVVPTERVMAGAAAVSPSAATSSPALKAFKLPLTSRGAPASAAGEVTPPPATATSGGMSFTAKSRNPAPLATDVPEAAVAPVQSGFAEQPAPVSLTGLSPLPAQAPAPGLPSSAAISAAESAQAAAPSRPSVSLARPTVAPAASAEQVQVKPVGAGRSQKTKLALLACVLVVVLAAVGVYLGSESPEAVTSPVVVVPAKRPAVVTPVVVAPPVDSAPLVSSAPVLPPPPVVEEPAAGVAHSRKPELESWLKSAVLSAVSQQRIILNDKPFAQGAAVNPEGTLTWIGRDSATRELLFVDQDGVVYTKLTLTSAK